MARTTKSASRKRAAKGIKTAKKAKQPRKVPRELEKIVFRIEGKMSTFGGPLDVGIQPDEGLALFGKTDLEDPKYADLFLPSPPPGTRGLGRRLNPEKFYFACRWDYSDTSREFLRRSLASVENPRNRRKVDARPVEWGPHESTGRVADLSPGLAKALELNANDVVIITISARRAIPVKTPKPKRASRIADFKFIKRIGGSNINTLGNDASAFFYEAGLMIDADGAHHAYHPDGRSGLDYLANAGQPGNWWALVTHNGESNGQPLIQTATDPAPGFYIASTSLQDPNRDRKDPRRYVNSEAVNFIVLPRGLDLGAKLGDFATVIRPASGVCAYAVYADVGPVAKIGEGSIALAAALGIPSNPKTGGIAHGIIYLVLPGSGRGWPLSQSEINRYASPLFRKWGGIAMAKACFRDLQWQG
jgi:hypothetical protein